MTTEKSSTFYCSRRELSQLKHWLKSSYKISIEEFVVLFKVYEGKKISGKELRDTLHFEMLWDTSKIDVIIRKIYRKNSFLNYDLKLMNDKYFISLMQRNRNYLIK